jgi:hypothetical protein
MSIIERFARRCMTSPAFLGFALATYRDRHGLTDELLAAELGCTLADYWSLCACGPVRREHVTADLREIAPTVRRDVVALARVVLA